jgi:hypothetical protein
VGIVPLVVIFSRIQKASLEAFFIGILWIKVLGFLQLLNRKLAAYILAVVEMIKDIWQFILVLLVMVIAFGDMFFAIYGAYREDERVCAGVDELDSRSPSPFCDPLRYHSYLAVYGLLVGDTSMENFDANGTTLTLFVLVTFLGIIVLLNMLIALVSESYGESLKRSRSLFGRTRIALVAKSILVEEVLTTKTRGCWGRVFKITTWLLLLPVIVGILGYTILLSIVSLIIYVSDGDFGKDAIMYFFVGVAFAVLVTLVLGYLGVLPREWALVKFIKGCFHYCCALPFRYCFAFPARFITLSLLGARKEYCHDDNGGWDKLGGRLKSKDQVAILRLDKKLDQLQKQQDGDSERLDKTLDQLARLYKTLDRIERQQRRDFVELRKLLEERDVKRQEDTLAND